MHSRSNRSKSVSLFSFNSKPSIAFLFTKSNNVGIVATEVFPKKLILDGILFIKNISSHYP